jgi:hypothetical protein
MCRQGPCGSSPIKHATMFLLRRIAMGGSHTDALEHSCFKGFVCKVLPKGIPNLLFGYHGCCLTASFYRISQHQLTLPAIQRGCDRTNKILLSTLAPAEVPAMGPKRNSAPYSMHAPLARNTVYTPPGS